VAPNRAGGGVLVGRWIAALATAVLVLTGCTASRWEENCETTGQGVIECPAGSRAQAPTLAGELLDGTRYDLGVDRGQVVVINFWGSWCPPCRAEAADLEATYQATRDRGVRFLGINVKDERDKARAFEEGRVSYPSLFDPASRLALDFDISPNTIPATLVLDRAGGIAVVIRQAVRQDGLQPIIERLAAEVQHDGSDRPGDSVDG